MESQEHSGEQTSLNNQDEDNMAVMNSNSMMYNGDMDSFNFDASMMRSSVAIKAEMKSKDTQSKVSGE